MQIPWPHFRPSKSESQDRPWESPLKASTLGDAYHKYWLENYSSGLNYSMGVG